jgi:CheY-like chemotaxis protein
MLQKSLPAEAAQAERFQAQRMEIVGRLTGGVVHDFNNILTVITGTIEILAEAVADRPELAAIANLIEEAAARGANLTSHLLAFARGQPSRPRDIDVNALIGEAARLLRPTLGECTEIDTLLAPDLPPVLVDPHQLMTALLNLAVIARDEMPDGGRPSFETFSPGGALDTAAEVSDGQHVMIKVRATGHGISSRDPCPCFTDIGAISDFVGRSNGHIGVHSDSGRGTSVDILLPIAAWPAPAPEDGGPLIAGGTELILIVEDDGLVRKYVVSQVRSLGYRTLTAGNAGEALALIDAGNEIDLLFTDVMMPGAINGRQLAVEALDRRPSLKVLYTSGSSDNAMVDVGNLDAGVLLLAKPYRKIELAKMIRAALAG